MGAPVIMPIGSMYGIYANIGGILMVNLTIYGIHGSYGMDFSVVGFTRPGQRSQKNGWEHHHAL